MFLTSPQNRGRDSAILTILPRFTRDILGFNLHNGKTAVTWSPSRSNFRRRLKSFDFLNAACFYKRSTLGVTSGEKKTAKTEKKTESKTETEKSASDWQVKKAASVNDRILDSKRDGKGGWGKKYTSANEFFMDYASIVAPNAFEAFNQEFNNAVEKHNAKMSITDAVTQLQEAVRRDEITMRQALEYFEKAYNKYGIDGMSTFTNFMYNADKDSFSKIDDWLNGNTAMVKNAESEPSKKVSERTAEEKTSKPKTVKRLSGDKIANAIIKSNGKSEQTYKGEVAGMYFAGNKYTMAVVSKELYDGIDAQTINSNLLNRSFHIDDSNYFKFNGEAYDVSNIGQIKNAVIFKTEYGYVGADKKILARFDGYDAYFNGDKSIGVSPIVFKDADGNIAGIVFPIKLKSEVESIIKSSNGTTLHGFANSTAETTVKYSDRDNRYLAKNPEEYKKPITAEDIQTLRDIGKKSINEFTSEDIQKAAKWAYKFYQELGTKSPFFRAWFGDWRAYDNTGSRAIFITNSSNTDFTTGNAINSDTNTTMSWNKDVGKESVLNAPTKAKSVIKAVSSNLDNVVKNAILLDTFVSDHDAKRKMKNTAFMHSFYCPVIYDGRTYIVKMFAEQALSNNEQQVFTRAYSLKNIEIATSIDSGVLFNNEGLTDSQPVATKYSISDLFKLVKTYDKEFSPKAVNPALLNEDGTPKVFYHGTSLENGDFTVFDESKAKKKFGHGMRALGKGNYFTSNGLSDNKRYGKGRIIDAYLHLNQPIIVDGESYESAVNRILNDDISKYSSDDIQIMLREKGYDGVIVSEPNGNYIVNVFDSNNIKSATDNIGTFDSANPDIRYSDRDNRYLDLAKNPEEYKKPITAEDIQTLRSIGKKSINEFTSEDIQKAAKWAYKFYQELGTKSPFFRAWFGDWRANDNSKVSIVNVETTNISKSNLKYGNYRINDTNWDVYAGRTLKKDTTHHSGGERINVKSLFAIKSILENAVLFDTITSENDTDTKAKYTAFLHKLVTPINYNGKILLAITTIEEYYNDSTNEAERRAYHIKAIKIESADGRLEKISTSPMSDTDSNISISDLFKLVKTYDKEFSPKAVNPALLNEDGTPKVFYHGTTTGGFNVFNYDSNRQTGTDYGKAFYFTTDLEKAKGYAYDARKDPEFAAYTKGKDEARNKYLENPSEENKQAFLNYKYNGKTLYDILEGTNEIEGSEVKSVYLSMKNPLVVDAEGKYYYQVYPDYFNTAKSNGNDGIIIQNVIDNPRGKPRNMEVGIVFDNTQIKSATDNIGTFDSANPDIRYSDRNPNETVAEIEARYERRIAR